jgi:hypothetical protein
MRQPDRGGSRGEKGADVDPRVEDELMGAVSDDWGKRRVAEATDNEIASVVEAVANRMTDTRLSGSELRERLHLDPFVKDEFEKRSGTRPASKRFMSDAFVGLGPVDVVSGKPRCLIELKWSYEQPCKVFESLWDAIKLAILGPEHGYGHLYVVTGASMKEWETAVCRELFNDGPIYPAELWARPLEPMRGPNSGTTVGEDLVIGGRGNQPSEAPEEIRTRRVATCPVSGEFEVRAMRIVAASNLRPWRQIPYPPALGF